MKEDDEVTSSQPDDEDKHSNGTTETKTCPDTSPLLRSISLGSWNPKGLTRVLRDVGLVEGNDKEIVQVSLSSPKDDELSQEIRSLQRQLRTCVEDTNETKRKLRKIMDE